MTRVKRVFSEEVKRKAVDDFISGTKSAEQIAIELGASASHVYKWRVRYDENAKGQRVDELQTEGRSLADARRFQELEAELDEYKRQLAEKTVIAELLKKRLQSKSSQQRSELSGLIETFELAAQKRKRVK
jgi:transposase-like protein